MTLDDFERRLQQIKPSLRLRSRGTGDIVSLYDGSDYICRLGKGELDLSGYRYMYFTDKLERHYGNIVKRGRKTLVKILEKQGIVKTLEQRASLLWGI